MVSEDDHPHDDGHPGRKHVPPRCGTRYQLEPGLVCLKGVGLGGPEGRT